MRKENNFSPWKTASIALFAILLMGCNAIIKKSDKNGKEEKNVQISTPFGDLKVRKEIDLKELGLTPYPDSRPVPDSKGSDDDSANVNISTPFFALKVTAAKYESSDTPTKIIDFYRKDMARYGKVISCKGSSGATKAEHKDDNDFSLKCDCNDVGGDPKNTTLKAGEGSSQHIVVVEPKDNATRIGLVHIRLHGGESETM
jgi:hypothetical protein